MNEKIAFQLRGGQITHDRRLDRLTPIRKMTAPGVSFRSQVSDITGIPEDTLMWTDIDWDIALHLNQGREGACGGFGSTHGLLSILTRVQQGEYGFGFARTVYTEAKKIDPWPGEDYEGTSVEACLEVLKSLGYIRGYIQGHTLEDLLLGMTYISAPVIGVSWYEGMMEVNENGYIHPTGERLGGHCATLSRQRLDSGQFRLHNSWGRDDWGVSGNAALSFADMEYLIQDDGEFYFLLK